MIRSSSNKNIIKMEKIASSEGEDELFFTSSKNYLYTLTEEAFQIEDKSNGMRIVDLKLSRSFDKGEKTSQKEKILEDPGFLQFSDFNNKNYSLSVSGLKLKSKSSGKFLVNTNRIFSHGSHYWEFHVPKSCIDIGFGVLAIDEDPSKNNSDPNNTANEFFVSFKTTTDRVVGLKLDLHNFELRSWLNGNPQPKKTLILPEGRQFEPAIKISGKIGKVVSLNPFANDPEEGPHSLLFVRVPIN